MNPIPDDVLKPVRASFLSTIDSFPIPFRELGARLADRLEPAQWTLEWGLPYWLAQSLSLNDTVRDELMLCNILGLSYVKLMDDLVDGEVAEEERSTTLLLGHRMYQEAVFRFFQLFPADSTFWPSFKSWIDEWLTATLPQGRSPQLPSSDGQDYSHLAKRGAPLKICCAAACILGGRSEAIPALTRAVEYALVALVLLDDFEDWESDLDGCRYNAFIEHVSRFDQIPDNIEVNRRDLLEALYVDRRSWTFLELVRKNLRRARETGLAFDIPQFEAYLTSLEERVTRHYLDLTEWHREGRRELVEMIFGPYEQASGTTGEIGG